ncbi:MAG: hypothetical protein IPL28_24900 [Chloroflexi bacterium]|nr:hypothetical protein [Chloroflexota bacterium]
MRAEPNEASPLLYAVPANTPLIVYFSDQYWAEIEWIGGVFTGPRRVWVPIYAIEILGE